MATFTQNQPCVAALSVISQIWHVQLEQVVLHFCSVCSVEASHHHQEERHGCGASRATRGGTIWWHLLCGWVGVRKGSDIWAQKVKQQQVHAEPCCNFSKTQSGNMLHWIYSTAVCLPVPPPKASPWPERVSGALSEVRRHISAVRNVSCASPSAAWWRHRLSTGLCSALWLSTHCV